MSSGSLFTSLCMLLFLSVPAAAQSWAEGMFDHKSHDFGTVSRGADVSHKFPVRNNTNQIVTLLSATSSCGCTKPSLGERKTLRPGETSYVKAVFNTRAFTGRKGATITVKIRGGQSRWRGGMGEVQLRVKGVIQTKLIRTPDAIAFGKLGRGETATQQMELTRLGVRSWQIEEIKLANDDSRISVIFQEQSNQNGRVTYNLNFLFKDTSNMPAFGPFSNTAHVRTSLNEVIPITITGEVAAPVSVAPSVLTMEQVQGGAPGKKKVMLRSDIPFKVLGVTSKSSESANREFFQVTSADQASARQIVTLSVDVGETVKVNREGYSDTVKIFVDHPEQREATLRVIIKVLPPQN